MAVYKRGDRWHYRFQVGGRPFSGSAGAGSTRAAAVQLEAQRRAQIAAESGGAARYSVDDAIARWLRDYAGRLKGASSLQSKVRAVVQHTHGADLTEIVEVAAKVRSAGVAADLAAATINRRLAILRRVANLAHEWGWLQAPLGQRIKLLPGEKARHSYLTPDEVERLAAACSNPACALAVRLSARTGLRKKEVLRASSIRSGCIEVIQDDAKSGRPRLVPLPPDMPGLILPLGITNNQLRRNFEAARRQVELPHVRFHDLRHTAASWWLATGASLATVRDLLGHSTIAVTSRYLHLMPGDLLRGAAAVDAMLGRTKTAQDDSTD
jgi:integrase